MRRSLMFPLLSVLLVAFALVPALAGAPELSHRAAVHRFGDVRAPESTALRSICSEDPASCGVPPSWGASDWFASTLVGSAGLALGGYVGVGLGAAAAGDCTRSEDDKPLKCLLNGLGHMAIGGSIGGLFGTASAVYAYGEGTGHDGNYWLTLAGSGTGLLASGLLIAASDDNTTVQFLTLALLPSLGATLGYVLSRDTTPAEAPPIGGLLTFDDGTPSLGVPGVGVSLSDDGELGLDLTLVKGVF